VGTFLRHSVDEHSQKCLLAAMVDNHILWFARRRRLPRWGNGWYKNIANFGPFVLNHLECVLHQNLTIFIAVRKECLL